MDDNSILICLLSTYCFPGTKLSVLHAWADFSSLISVSCCCITLLQIFHFSNHLISKVFWFLLILSFHSFYLFKVPFHLFGNTRLQFSSFFMVMSFWDLFIDCREFILCFLIIICMEFGKSPFLLLILRGNKFSRIAFLTSWLLISPFSCFSGRLMPSLLCPILSLTFTWTIPFIFLRRFSFLGSIWILLLFESPPHWSFVVRSFQRSSGPDCSSHWNFLMQR